MRMCKAGEGLARDWRRGDERVVKGRDTVWGGGGEREKRKEYVDSRWRVVIFFNPQHILWLGLTLIN